LRALALALAMACCGLLKAVEVDAQVSGSGSQAFPLQNENGQPRAGAMGSAYVAVAEGAEGQINNPAGLAFAGSNLAIAHDQLQQGAFQESVLGGVDLGKGWGGLGGRIEYVDYGSMDLSNSQGQALGSADIREERLGINWGACLLQGFALGLGLKDTHQSLGNDSEDSLGLDAGLLWKALPGLRLATAVHGVGGQASQGQRYYLWESGAAWDLPFRQFGLLASVETAFDQLGGRELRSGLEAAVLGSLALRAGLRAGLQTGGTVDYTMGLGIALGGYCLDYAWLPQAQGGDVQELGLRWNFGPATFAEPQAKPLAAPPALAEAPSPALTPAAMPAPTLSRTPLAEPALIDPSLLPPPPSIPEPTSSTATVGAGILHGDVLSPAAGQALTLETLGLAEAAFESYLRCAADDPLDAHCWRGLARAYQACGQAEQARSCWQQVRALDPDAVDAATYLNSLP
jgi:hypothetical protein